MPYDVSDIGQKRKQEVLGKSSDADTQDTESINEDQEESSPPTVPTGDEEADQALAETENIEDDLDNSNAENTEEDESMEDDLSETDENRDQTQVSPKKKEELRDKMVMLYETILGNIDLLNEYIGEHSNLEFIHDINHIIDNLTHTNKVLYKTLVSGVNNAEYADLLKVYTGAQRIYDISISMVEEHCKNVKKKQEEDRKQQQKLSKKQHHFITTFQ